MRLITSAAFFIVLLAAPAAATASQFCDGFKQGYITGYKQAARSSLSPLVQTCPLQPLRGFGDPKSDFEHGYTLGYKYGAADGSR